MDQVFVLAMGLRARMGAAFLAVCCLVMCGGKVDGLQAGGTLMQTPAIAQSQDACSAITDWRSCGSHECIWGGPDLCDNSEPAPVPDSEIDRLARGGCFTYAPCATDADCEPTSACSYLAYAPCYFTKDGDGPQCNAYYSQFCTYVKRCTPRAR